VTAILPTSVLEIGKKNMIRALHAHTAFADHFRNYLLGRNVRSEEDLIDHLFNPGEKRLARLLLKLNEFGGRHNFDTALPKVSQQLLAEMIGASRQQVNALMNKFKKLGFIEYDGGLTIHRSLATVMLSD
jgi:CRP-like cAMP-binding protein